MANFTAILSKTIVASSPNCVNTTSGFQNITGVKLLANLRRIAIGIKDGSHFLRCDLAISDAGTCLARSDANAASMASVLVLDCDKRVTSNGEELEGAPDPLKVSNILLKNDIAHVLYGSHSHYVGNKGNRYRIILATKNPYNKTQLTATLETVISLINLTLEGDLLVNSKENRAWSQPWYYPRKPANSIVPDLYFEHLEGDTVEIVEPLEMPPIDNNSGRSTSYTHNGEISPINAFNEQYRITDLLAQYGYKKAYITKEYEKWRRPDSTSGKAGITVKNNKIFSHHDDKFNDGYWHDAFDFMRIYEGLSENEALKKAARNTQAPDGRTVDEYNKNSARKNTDCVSTIPLQPIPHAEILAQLSNKVTVLDFRNIVNIADTNEKLKAYHFHVIAVETVLHLAKQNNWGICRNHDFFYIFNGAYWSFVDKDELKAFLGKAAEKMGIDKFWARSSSFRKQLYEQFIALAHFPKPEQPKEIVFINLKNGTFKITPKDTRLEPFNCDDFLTYQLPFEYNPQVIAPLFEKYLSRVLPDKNLQNILSEYLGYVFIKTSTLKLEKTLLLYGSGANGKSVFYEIVRSLFGEKNTSEYSLQTLTNDSGYQRAMIANKLVNYASEINGKLEASIFKQLVSGEPVEARLPYSNPFIMTDYAKLIFNCNDLPKDVEQTEAYFRRFLIIPFNVTIPEDEQDKQLAKKIIDTELSGIFNWVLEGLKRLLIQKQFTDSEIVRNARRQYENESDSVRLFMDEYEYEPSITGCILVKTLYNEYRKFCLDDGYKAVSFLNFRKRLERANIVVSRRNSGNIAFVSKIIQVDISYSQASGR